MKYFFDTEFYEDGSTIDLISIGIVAEDGREFYAVSQEAQLHRVDPWLRENVLPHLPPYGDPAWRTRREIADELILLTGLSVPFTSPRGTSGAKIATARFDPKPEFWAYYGAYDWVVLCQLFGTMMGLPKHFPKFCRDLKQLSVDVGSPEHPPKPVNAHSAIVDARWNRDLYALLDARRPATQLL